MLERYSFKSRKPSRMPWLYTSIVALIAIFAISIVIMSYFPASKRSKDIILHVPPNSNVEEIASILKSQSLIWSKQFFKLVSRVRGYDRKLRAGHFLIPEESNQEMIFYYLTQNTGSHYLTKITIPEGFTIQQIAEKLEENLVCSGKDFEIFAHKTAKLHFKSSYDFLKDSPLTTLEGYLFPETYFFKQNEPIEIVVKSMLDQFQEKIWIPFQTEERFKSIRLPFHKALSLAAMIQKESRIISEMPRISSVFHNRLQRKMRLESDPTVVYAMGKSYKDRVYYKDLKTKSPYNTYRVWGVPPTPIAAVGIKAFEAACFPEKNRYLFFVAKQDGSHYFSYTYKEHLDIQRKLKTQGFR